MADLTPAEAAEIISEMTGTNAGRLLNDAILAAQKGGEARHEAWPEKWRLGETFEGNMELAASPSAWFRFHLVENAERVLNEFHVGRPIDPQLPLALPSTLHGDTE